MKKIIMLVILILLLSGCCYNDKNYNTAKCNNEEYDIVSFTRWSDSYYELELKDGNKIAVHPMNCMFYNKK